MEPFTAEPRSFMYLAETSVKPVGKHLADICRAIDLLTLEIKQGSLNARKAVVFNIPHHIPLDTLKNVVFSARNTTDTLATVLDYLD